MAQLYGYADRSDSELERQFRHHVCKYLRPDAKLTDHVLVETQWATFEIDFVITVAGRRIAIEVDGRQYHADSTRDELRDAIVLGVGAADVLWRIRGTDFWHSPEDCLYLVSLSDTYVFDDRGRRNLEVLASADVRDDGPRQAGNSLMYLQVSPEAFDEDVEGDGDWREMYLLRKTLDRQTVLFGFAEDNGGLTFRQLVAAYRRHMEERRG